MGTGLTGAHQSSGVAWRVREGREQVQVAVYDPKLLAVDQKIAVNVPPTGLVYTEVLVACPRVADVVASAVWEIRSFTFTGRGV